MWLDGQASIRRAAATAEPGMTKLVTNLKDPSDSVGDRPVIRIGKLRP
jgi:hypothetical protein